MSNLLQIDNYLEKSFVVVGNTSPRINKLSELGGVKNYNGWVFPSSSKSHVQKYVEWVNNYQDGFPIIKKYNKTAIINWTHTYK